MHALARLFLAAALTAPLIAEPDFVHEVAPILKKHCAECHTDMKKKGGLSMNTEDSFWQGSENCVNIYKAQVLLSRFVCV
ncbi:MAG: hypothetical protein CFE26_04245 [Verrucomicrobiales bacterium VVV1]|nr:MAG: hypothetical protein CFE26_04245 [Verrucomicrobiales bacterium VVV1]